MKACADIQIKKAFTPPPPPIKCIAVSPGKFRFFLFIFFCFSLPLLPAQTAAEMDTLLETGAVSFGQAARFVLDTANLIDPVSAGKAFVLARQKGWLPEGAREDGPIRTGELSFLIMNAFGMQGSFLYRLFPGPRYAFRELDYRGLLPGCRDPALRVSGEGLLRILSMTASYLGRAEAEVSAPWDTPAETAAAVPPPVESPPAEIPADQAVPPPPEIPPPPETPPPSLQERREETAEHVRTELDQQKIADTTVRVAEEGVVISLNNIQFMADSAVLTQREKNKLWEIAGILSQYPERKILVGGHTALAGTEEMRLQISIERAGAVADFLVSLGVRQAGEILVRGYGARQPLGDNATEAGRALNRRVEIILLDE
jgi:outer membrane protein OmpA-like peptidoglycan-associated protein